MGESNRLTKPRVWLSGPAKIWTVVVSVMASIDGLVWLAFPGSVQNAAYQLAFDVAPVWCWGVAMSGAGGAASLAIWYDGRSWAPEAARLAIALYLVVCFVVGLSIFALTLSGSASALTGSAKWWAVTVTSLAVLAGPGLVSDERSTWRELTRDRARDD